MIEIYNEDCLEGMKRISDGAVDFCLIDPPFGTTDCDFDKPLPPPLLWEQLLRITKLNGAIVLFSQMPFGAELIMSQRKLFRYEWIWLKPVPAGFLNANRMPLRAHEDILVFYRKLPTYNPQYWQSAPYKNKRSERTPCSAVYSDFKNVDTPNASGKRFPIDCIKFNNQHTLWGRSKTHHPNEKPVDLLEYLIRTYSNQGEVVMDCTMGSGSTGVACVNTGRRFIGFELEEKFYDIARERIEAAQAVKESALF